MSRSDHNHSCMSNRIDALGARRYGREEMKIIILLGSWIVSVAVCSASIIMGLDCSPDTADVKCHIWEIEQNKTQIAEARDEHWTFRETLRSIGEDAFESLFGKPSLETSGLVERKRVPSGYAIPLFMQPCVAFSGLGYKGNYGSRFYPVSDLGGVLMFPYGDGKFVSAVFIYLKIDDKFVPIRSTADYKARTDWDSAKLKLLTTWIQAEAKKKGIELQIKKTRFN